MLQETILKPVDKFYLKNFKIYRANAKSRKGVAIIVSNQLDCDTYKTIEDKYGRYIQIKLKNEDEIKYYIKICEQQHLSQRQLSERIKNHEYDRLSEDTKNKLKEEKGLTIGDLVPNPIIVKVDSIDIKLS